MMSHFRSDFTRAEIALQAKTYYHMNFQWKSVKKEYINMKSNNLIALKVVHIFVADV